MSEEEPSEIYLDILLNKSSEPSLLNILSLALTQLTDQLHLGIYFSPKSCHFFSIDTQDNILKKSSSKFQGHLSLDSLLIPNKGELKMPPNIILQLDKSSTRSLYQSLQENRQNNQTSIFLDNEVIFENGSEVAEKFFLRVNFKDKEETSLMTQNIHVVVIKEN